MSVVQKVSGAWRRMRLVACGWLVCEVVTRVTGAMPDARVLSAYFSRGGTGLLGLYDRMAGGALSSGSVLALGIMPYLSARIFRGLAGVVSPAVARLEHMVVLGATATFMGWLCAQATDDEGDVERNAPGLLREATPDIGRDRAKRVVTPVPSISGSHRRG